MKNLFLNEHLKIDFNEENQWLDVDWTGFQNFKSMQDGGLKMLDFVIKYKCSKVLNDNSHVMGNWEEGLEWGVNVWFPAMYEAGVQYFAWIYSLSKYSKISADKAIGQTDFIIFKTFYERNEAEKWLKKI